MSTTSNRRQPGALVFGSGVLAGVLCFAAAEVLVPRSVRNPGDHDIFLATRVGFIYAPAVGAWLGWLQKSWRRATIGIVVGLAIGILYMQLCGSRNFLAIMVAFPGFLGGLLASFTGSNRSPWLPDLLLRLGKGVLAGLVLGLVYMITLNIGVSFVFERDFIHDPMPAYVKAMWRAGPVALGLASGFFFPLIRWAVGLTRVRLIVFDDVEPESVRS